MASYDLSAFQPIHDIQLVGAIDSLSPNLLQIGFWINDPYQQIEWQNPTSTTDLPRQDFLWEQTCFEVFIGIKNQDDYREINLVPDVAWQAYQFEEYRFPENMPPIAANDIKITQLQRTRFGLTAVIDIADFLKNMNIQLRDIFIGLTAVIKTTQNTHYFAMQHAGKTADFHNKRDWLHAF